MKLNLGIFNVIMGFLFLAYSIVLYAQGELGRAIMWVGVSVISFAIAHLYRKNKKR